MIAVYVERGSIKFINIKFINMKLITKLIHDHKAPKVGHHPCGCFWGFVSEGLIA